MVHCAPMALYREGVQIVPHPMALYREGMQIVPKMVHCAPWSAVCAKNGTKWAIKNVPFLACEHSLVLLCNLNLAVEHSLAAFRKVSWAVFHVVEWGDCTWKTSNGGRIPWLLREQVGSMADFGRRGWNPAGKPFFLVRWWRLNQSWIDKLCWRIIIQRKDVTT